MSVRDWILVKKKQQNGHLYQFLLYHFEYVSLCKSYDTKISFYMWSLFFKIFVHTSNFDMQNRKLIFEKILRRIKFIHIIIRRVYSFRFFAEEIYIWIIIFITQNILRIKGIKKYIFKIFIFDIKINFPLRR